MLMCWLDNLQECPARTPLDEIAAPAPDSSKGAYLLPTGEASKVTGGLAAGEEAKTSSQEAAVQNDEASPYLGSEGAEILSTHLYQSQQYFVSVNNSP